MISTGYQILNFDTGHHKHSIHIDFFVYILLLTMSGFKDFNIYSSLAIANLFCLNCLVTTHLIYPNMGYQIPSYTVSIPLDSAKNFNFEP
jgi:hypothetical protein